MKEEVLKKLIVKAEKNDGVISRKDFEKIVPSDESEEAEEFLKEREIYVMDDLEDDEIIDEKQDVMSQIPRKLLGSKTYAFLKEISQYKRMSTEEEKRHMIIVERGRNAEKRLAEAKENELDDETIKSLNVMIDNGNAAREKIIYSYHSYVLSFANHYVRCGAQGNIQYKDLVSAGFDGLVKAFNSYDFNKGAKFGTYARWEIMNSIQEVIASLRNAIAVPKTTQTNRMNVFKIINQFEIKYGRKPTEEEIVDEMGITSPKKRAKKITAIRILIDSSKPSVNLDTKITDGEDGDTYDKFIPSDIKSPFEVYIEKENKTELYNILNKSLTTREIGVLYKRFGINCDRIYTLEEIGAELNLTRERVRQIQDEALLKLRNGQYSEILREMLPK